LQIGFLFVLSDLAAERGLLSERVTFDSIGVSHAQGCFASCPLVFQSAATIRPGRHYLEVPRYEVGIQFDFHYLDGVGEWGGGFGPRFHYNFNEHFALDSELTYRQHNVSTFNSLIPTSTVIGQTTGLFWVRAGQRVQDFGLCVQAGAGFLHFGTNHGVSLLTRNTVPAFNVGGVIERYSGPVVLRFDMGEMIVAYGNAQVSVEWPGAIAGAQPSKNRT
jgi:hypothetical protein